MRNAKMKGNKSKRLCDVACQHEKRCVATNFQFCMSIFYIEYKMLKKCIASQTLVDFNCLFFLRLAPIRVSCRLRAERAMISSCASTG